MNRMRDPRRITHPVGLEKKVNSRGDLAFRYADALHQLLKTGGSPFFV